MIRSTFATLNLANRALTSQQIAIDITSHNIANTNTDGYTRQAAELIASVPFTITGMSRPQQAGQLGTGVDVANVKRFRDGFVDLQFRQEQQLLGRWETSRDELNKIERTLNEPSDEGLASALSKFWNQWSALANNPEGQANRQALAESASTLANQMNHLYSTLESQQRNLDTQLQLDVKSVNNLTEQIARLNDQVIRIVGAGDQPNDLRDQRDKLIDDLSKLVNITYSESANGAVTVNIGGRTAVYANQSFALKTQEVTSSGFSGVYWADSFRDAQVPPVALDAAVINGGQMAGVIESRDIRLRDALDGLQSLGATLVTQVNDVHSRGFGINNVTGLPFFTGTGADDIAVSDVITGDLDNIAAASSQLSPGDGSNALAVHDIQSLLTMNNGGASMEDFYAGLVANIGILSQQAQGMAKNETLLRDHLSDQRQSIGGVSLDEETTNLIRYQHAYNAAARVVTTIDQMLDRIINNMGIVGR